MRLEKIILFSHTSLTLLGPSGDIELLKKSNKIKRVGAFLPHPNIDFKFDY